MLKLLPETHILLLATHATAANQDIYYCGQHNTAARGVNSCSFAQMR